MKSKQSGKSRPPFVGPFDVCCLGCGERRDPPIWRVC